MISIITPTFNSSILISETVDSLFGQTFHDWECIFVDDGSSDNTIEILEYYRQLDNRLSFYTRPENTLKGPSSCRNYGLKFAKGDYIIFLDSDDLLADFCLEQRIKFAKENPDFDFFIFKMKVFSSKINKDAVVFNQLNFHGDESSYYLDLLLRGQFPFQTMCPFWKKESVIKLEGFDENLRMLEDPDLHTRAYKENMKSKTAILLEADCYYRVPENRIEKAKYYNKIESMSNFYFLKKHFIINNESVKTNYKRIINLYGFSKTSFKILIKMFSLGKHYKIINNKHIFLGLIIYLYSLLNLSKIKGTGYARLRTKFNAF